MSRVFEKIPAELLVDILLRRVREQESPPYDYPYRRRIVLSSVCKNWQHTIDTCPLFWFEINIEEINNVSKTLSKSGTTMPLEINCGFHEPHTEQHRFLDIVIPYAHRWKLFKIGTDLKHRMLQILRLPTPILETLWLGFGPPQLYAPEYVGSPKIRDLTTVGLWLPRSIIGMPTH